MKRTLATLSLGASLSLISSVACGTTAGAPATASLRLATSTGSFTTSTGWTVALDEAVLVLGSTYLYAPDGDTTALLREVLLPVAHAHGGHDPFGTRPVRLEWLGPASLDLLEGVPGELGVMEGSVGVSTDATLAFAALEGALADPSGASRAHHAWIAGTATRTVEGSTEVVAFEGGLDFATGGTENLVEAVAADAMVSTEGTWTLQVDLARWLDQARFERLPDAETPRPIAPTSQVGIAWDLGLRDPASYLWRYEPLTP
jgi:hypothetical protein